MQLSCQLPLTLSPCDLAQTTTFIVTFQNFTPQHHARIDSFCQRCSAAHYWATVDNFCHQPGSVVPADERRPLPDASARMLLPALDANLSRHPATHQTLAAIYSCHIHCSQSLMSTSTVFTNNRSQAVRLPANARLPPHVKRVEVRVRGAERIISPAGHTWDSFFAPDAPRASDDFLQQRASQDQTPRQGL